jgi:hypothetical protein
MDVDLAAIALCCPGLQELRIDNAMFLISSQYLNCLPKFCERGGEYKAFANLRRLGLNTPLPIGEFEASYVFLPPAVMAFCLKNAPGLESADFGYCSVLEDSDVDRVVSGDYSSEDFQLPQAATKCLNPSLERVTLRGACKLSNEAVFKLIKNYPCLQMLALKILPRDRLAELESVKTQLKAENVNVTLMTYGNY